MFIPLATSKPTFVDNGHGTLVETTILRAPNGLSRGFYVTKLRRHQTVSPDGEQDNAETMEIVEPRVISEGLPYDF